MNAAGMLLGAALALPLAMLLACLSSRLRTRMPALLAIAPVPALAAALLGSGGTLALPQMLLLLRFALDVPGALLLGVAALLWIAAGIYASAWLHGRPDGGRFVVWWLLTLSGSIGVFIAADLVSFYLVFSMVSLAAYGLIVDDGTPRARRNGLIYVALALLGEAFLLMAFVLLAQGIAGDSLLIRDAVAALPTSPWRASILILLILGFGAKIGLVPFHVWMPLAYRAAPIPAAAVLSGAAVKAGVIGLIRFLPLDVATPGWGEALVVAGLFSAFYGVAIGITQRNPKTVLAYSSVSQMGVIGTVLGMGLAAGDGDAALSVGFYAAHHTLAKGALFLAVGVAQIDRSTSPVAGGTAAGNDIVVGSRRVPLDWRRACETRCQGARRRRHRGHAHEFVIGRNHAPDASLPVPPRRLLCGECDIDSAGTVGLAVAGHGTRLCRGSVGDLPDSHGRIDSRRRRARDPLVGVLAVPAWWRAGDRSSTLGRSIAARSRRGYRGCGGGGRNALRACHGRVARAVG